MMLQLECSNRTEGPPPVTLYPLLVIIMAVILFLLLITSLSFTISYRYRCAAVGLVNLKTKCGLWAPPLTLNILVLLQMEARV